MKIFNRHVYLLITRQSISKDKLDSIKKGDSHIRRNPVRKKPIEKEVQNEV